jgi:hypothetical protein
VNKKDELLGKLLSENDTSIKIKLNKKLRKARKKKFITTGYSEYLLFGFLSMTVQI